MLALTVVAAVPGAAQTTCAASNVIKNCSFEVGDPPLEWDPVTGTNFARSPVAEHGDSAGSLQSEPGVISPFFYSYLRSNCFPVQTPTNFTFGGSFAPSVPQEGYCNVVIESFETAECNYWERTGYLGGSSAAVLADAWVHPTGFGEVVGPFAQLELTCSIIGPGAPFLFDSAFAVPEALIDVPALGWSGLVLLVALLAAVGSVSSRRH